MEEESMEYFLFFIATFNILALKNTIYAGVKFLY